MKKIMYNGKIYKQIQRRTAEKLFYQGKQINIIACNANPNSPWINGFYELSIDLLSKHDDYVAKYDNNFAIHVNNYEYYNCNAELGRHANCYIIAD